MNVSQRLNSTARSGARQSAPMRCAAAQMTARVSPMAAPPSTAVQRAPRANVKSVATRNPIIRCAAAAVSPSPSSYKAPGQNCDQVNVVYKFGGSSVRDAERMIEVADIICSFPQYLPCVVLSAMGKTTNMLLECGELALTTPTDEIPNLEPLNNITKLHMETCATLGVEPEVQRDVGRLLKELSQLLVGISIMQDLTPRAKDSLVSFGERLSTRIFASYLRSKGVPAQQFDAFEIGMITTDDFMNAEVIYDESLPKIKKVLTLAPGAPKALPIVTGFLGRAISSGAVTTLGRGGSDLTATVLGAALDLDEVQVWKDVDGVLTSDPRIVPNTKAVNELTFEEATELAYFGAQVLHPAAMQPAIRSGKLNVRVKNSYNRSAPGSIISSTRDMKEVLVTSIVLKNNVTLVDIISTRMMGQFGFLARVFESFKRNRISVDVVATSEVSVSLTLDSKKYSGDQDMEQLKSDLAQVAEVSYRKGDSIVSLICNVNRTSEILEKVFGVFNREAINVKMISQGASKTNISLVVDGALGQKAVQVLHREFFEAPRVPQLSSRDFS